jgi:hypothetical protein
MKKQLSSIPTDGMQVLRAARHNCSIPAKVINDFLSDLRNFAMSTYDSNLWMFAVMNNSDIEYEEFVEPTYIPPEATEGIPPDPALVSIAIAKHNNDVQRTTNQLEKFKTDKRKFTGIILAHVDHRFRQLLEENDRAAAAITTYDVQVLFQEILSIATGRSLWDQQQSLYMARTDFSNLRQGEKESLSDYKIRFDQAVSQLRTAYEHAKLEMQDEVIDADGPPSDIMQIRQFVNNMSSNYDQYKYQLFEGHSSFPASIGTAIRDAEATAENMKIHVSHQRGAIASEVFIADSTIKQKSADKSTSKPQQNASADKNTDPTTKVKTKSTSAKITCALCGKVGHKILDCYRLESAKSAVQSK